MKCFKHIWTFKHNDLSIYETIILQNEKNCDDTVIHNSKIYKDLIDLDFSVCSFEVSEIDGECPLLITNTFSI